MRLTDLDKYWKSDDEFSTVALYDLSKDPSETTNLATLYPELVKELLAEAELAIKNAPKQTFTMVIYFQLEFEMIIKFLKNPGQKHSNINISI